MTHSVLVAEPDPRTGAVRIPSGATIAEGQVRAVRLGTRSLAVARVDGGFVAFPNQCLHLGVRLANGRFADGILECRWHHWRYDVRAGTVTTDDGSPSPPFRRFTVAVDGQDLIVALPSRLAEGS